MGTKSYPFSIAQTRAYTDSCGEYRKFAGDTMISVSVSEATQLKLSSHQWILVRLKDIIIIDLHKYGSASCAYIFLSSLSLTLIPSHIQKQSKL